MYIKYLKIFYFNLILKIININIIQFVIITLS